MKICYVLKWYPRLSQTFVLNELLELQRRGIDLTVVALKAPVNEPIHARYGELHAPVYYLPDLVAAAASGVDMPAGSPADQQAVVLGRFLLRQGVEHVHAHFASWAAGLAAAVGHATGLPFSFTAHARDIFHERVQAPVLAERIAQARFVVTVSNYNKRHLDALLHAQGKTGRVIRLYNGVDLRQLAPGAAHKEPDLIVAVGRLVAKKGFRYLVEACRLLRDRHRPVRCVIVGEGEERAALTEQIARYGLEENVVLAGVRTHTEVTRLVQNASVCVLPCVVDESGDRDGLPTVLLEAMALGTPVISTAVAGVPEMIDHGRSGLLVQERDTPQLASAIASVLDSPALSHSLRAAALERVQREFNLAENVRVLSGYFLEGRLAA